jgi:hypothetical protein
VTCSYVSIASTRITGVDVLVVDRKGKGRLKPQSPRANDVCGVVMERLMGYGSVAESELKLLLDERLGKGRGRVGGIANSLDARRSAPPGDVLLDAIAVDGAWL